MEQVADNIYLIDVLHVKPCGTCAYLIVGDGGDCALIDCGGKKGEGQILAALDELNISADAVRFLIVTHAHLDHAGCAGSLMRRLPNAVFAGHPSAVKHLVNPQMRLAAAVRGLYGDEFFDAEYGELLPIIEARAHSLQDGETIALNGKTLRAVYTPGHAWHHLSIVDESAGVVFVGDSFGVCYGNDKNGEAIVMPVLPPTQLDLDAARATVLLQSALPARKFALTHYGLIDNTPQAAKQQIERMDEWEALAARVAADNPADFRAAFEVALRDAVRGVVSARGAEGGLTDRYAGDTRLTSCGFAHLRDKGGR